MNVQVTNFMYCPFPLAKILVTQKCRKQTRMTEALGTTDLKEKRAQFKYRGLVLRSPELPKIVKWTFLSSCKDIEYHLTCHQVIRI